MLFSVIVPTRNRAGMLPLALSSLRAQRFPDEDFEILLVDNGSTDDTEAVVAALNAAGGKSIRYVFESQPGLHNARHRAAREARGDVLAFTDDDAEATELWLAALARAFADNRVGAAGGPIHVRWASEPPAWVVPLGGFGHLDYGPEFQELKWPHTIFGGNFAIRKRLVFELGGFHPDTSVEDRLVGDGETGLCRKLYRASWKIAYVPDALIYHVQEGARVTLASMRHRYAQQGRFHAYSDYKERRHSRLGLALRGARMYLRGLGGEASALGSLPFGAAGYHHRRVQAAGALASAMYYLRLTYNREFRGTVLRENWIDDV